MGARQFAVIFIAAAIAFAGCVSPEAPAVDRLDDDLTAPPIADDIDLGDLLDSDTGSLLPGVPDEVVDVDPGPGEEPDPEEPDEPDDPEVPEEPEETDEPEETEPPPAEEEELGDGIPEETEEDPDEEPPPPVCADDLHEENDVMGQASGLLVGYYGAMRSCDADWYSFDLQTGDLFSIELTADELEGELEVTVYNPAGEELATGGTATSDPDFEIEAEANGTYYVLIDLAADTGSDLGAEYSMLVSWTELECPGDPFEPNDTDLQPWPVPPGTLSSLNVCPAADDWFAVWLEPGEELTAEVVFDDSEGDLDLTLYGPGGIWLSESATLGSVESVTIEAADSGYHQVWIELVEDLGVSTGTEYDLTLDLPSP